MVAQISERRRNANRVDHEGACKRKLCIYRIDKSGCQGTRDTSQGLGRVEESHDKVFLFRIRLIRHHVLEDRDADGIARINENTEEDEKSPVVTVSCVFLGHMEIDKDLNKVQSVLDKALSEFGNDDTYLLLFQVDFFEF